MSKPRGPSEKASRRPSGAPASSPTPSAPPTPIGARPLFAPARPDAPGVPALTPGEHVRLLVELLQPTGPELARRWLAILAMVPREEREALVREVARRVVEAYASNAAPEEVEFKVVSPPVQRAGYVEQVETTYVVDRPKAEARPATVAKGAKRA